MINSYLLVLKLFFGEILLFLFVYFLAHFIADVLIPTDAIKGTVIDKYIRDNDKDEYFFLFENKSGEKNEYICSERIYSEICNGDTGKLYFKDCGSFGLKTILFRIQK